MKHYLWNMFANLKNAQKAKKSITLYNNIHNCTLILDILWQEGYILGYRVSNINKKKIEIFLKYKNGKPVINDFKSITKPSKRVYYSSKQLWKVDFNSGICILSTNKGFMSIEGCKKKNIGGELFIIIK